MKKVKHFLKLICFFISITATYAQDWNVHVAAFDKKVNATVFAELNGIYFKQDGNIYHYYLRAKDKAEADALKEKAILAGFKYAKLVDLVEQANACKKSCLECQSLKNIFFDFDRATLRGEAKSDLTKLADVMTMNPSFTCDLSAHTDAKGDLAYNQNLSKLRAEAARNYLITKGIAASRIKVLTNGEEKPIAKNELENGADTEEGRQFNRRVEIYIKDGDDKVVNRFVEEIKVPEPLKLGAK
jgi:outer membrane protein OmpA-like peptidoglycan-associated protein